MPRSAARCLDAFGQSYHRSLMQVEYATDLAFRSTTSLGPLYEQLIRETVLSVKAEQIATFLGRQITPLLAQEIGSRFSTRIEGTCVKHRFGKCSIKMYDKCGIYCASRPPPTTCPSSTTERWNTATGRRPGHRAAQENHLQPDRPARDTGWLQPALSRSPVRADFSAGVRALGRLTKPHEVDGKTVKGINFFEPGDSALLHALQNPSVNIAGIRRAELLPNLEMFSPARLSRQLRRLLDLGVIKRIKGTYRYYLTAGRAATTAAERLKQATIVPAMI